MLTKALGIGNQLVCCHGGNRPWSSWFDRSSAEAPDGPRTLARGQRRASWESGIRNQDLDPNRKSTKIDAQWRKAPLTLERLVRCPVDPDVG